MVKVWLEPALTNIVPEGLIAPFGPAKAVIVYWVCQVAVTVAGALITIVSVALVEVELPDHAANKY